MTKVKNIIIISILQSISMMLIVAIFQIMWQMFSYIVFIYPVIVPLTILTVFKFIEKRFSKRSLSTVAIMATTNIFVVISLLLMPLMPSYSASSGDSIFSGLVIVMLIFIDVLNLTISLNARFNKR